MARFCSYILAWYYNKVFLFIGERKNCLFTMWIRPISAVKSGLVNNIKYMSAVYHKCLIWPSEGHNLKVTVDWSIVKLICTTSISWGEHVPNYVPSSIYTFQIVMSLLHNYEFSFERLLFIWCNHVFSFSSLTVIYCAIFMWTFPFT